jgi:glycosyltransferase involved in cell wall biosynthesis
MMNTAASTEVHRQNPIVLSVAMPAYNEEANIERVVLEYIHVLESLQGTISDWEIVCLDDASTDHTLSILQELAARFPRLKVLRHLQNKGLFESMNDVSRSTSGTHVYLTASDGQWPAKNLPLLLDAVIHEHADLAIWVRRNRWQVYSLRRWILSSLFNLLPWILFGIRMMDAGSVKLGLRAIYASNLISRSPFVEAERILVAQRAGFRIAYVPADFQPRSGGRAGGASLKNILLSLRDCLRCARWYGLRSPRANPGIRS